MQFYMAYTVYPAVVTTGSVLLGQRSIFVVESVCTAAQFEKQVSDFNRLYQ